MVLSGEKVRPMLIGGEKASPTARLAGHPATVGNSLKHVAGMSVRLRQVAR